jgi:hypothetical protein
MLSLPGTETDFINWLQEKSKQRLEKFETEVGKQPDRFDEFILFRELESAGLSVKDAFEAYRQGNRKIMKAYDKRVSLKEAEPTIKMFTLEGIGFGTFFPELTEKMYRNAYEKIDADAWSEARAHGLAISEKPTIISLEEQEQTVLGMVAAYTAEYYPELLDPLDLKGHLPVEGESLE